MSERCEQTSEHTSEWPSTNVPIPRGSESLCKDLFLYKDEELRIGFRERKRWAKNPFTNQLD